MRATFSCGDQGIIDIIGWHCCCAGLQVAVDGLEPTYSVLRSPLLPAVCDDGGAEGPAVLPCRLWGNSDRDGDVSDAACVLDAV